MHDTHLVNVLGAGSLAIADLIDASVTGSARAGRSGSAALAVLLQAGGLSVTELGKRVGLSQPAAARMVATLEEAGQVQRRAGQGRQVRVELTETGRSSARLLLQHRFQQVAELLEGLSSAEQQTLVELFDKVLTRVYERVGDANLICRLCDRCACTSTGRRCPVGLAAGEAADA